MTVRHPRRTVLGVAGLVALAVTGCSQDPNSVAAQAKAGDQKGYVSGDGSVETIAPADRGEPVTMTGTLVDGTRVGHRLHPRTGSLVLNVWGSWCAPCVAEAPDLQQAWEEQQAKKAPVDFVGIDFREEPQRGAAFMKRAGITYPSLSDESGVLLLRLQGKAPTVPTTLVLDRDGTDRRPGQRPGRRRAPSPGLVDDVVAES